MGEQRRSGEERWVDDLIRGAGLRVRWVDGWARGFGVQAQGCAGSLVRTVAAVRTGEKATATMLHTDAAASPRLSRRYSTCRSAARPPRRAAAASALQTAHTNGSADSAPATPMELCTMRCGLYVASAATAQAAHAADVAPPAVRKAAPSRWSAEASRSATAVSGPSCRPRLAAPQRGTMWDTACGTACDAPNTARGRLTRPEACAAKIGSIEESVECLSVGSSALKARRVGVLAASSPHAREVVQGCAERDKKTNMARRIGRTTVTPRVRLSGINFSRVSAVGPFTT
jgi:hypothetical protein